MKSHFTQRSCSCQEHSWSLKNKTNLLWLEFSDQSKSENGREQKLLSSQLLSLGLAGISHQKLGNCIYLGPLQARILHPPHLVTTSSWNDKFFYCCWKKIATSVLVLFCFICVNQQSQEARMSKDAEDVTFSGKAVAWLAAGNFSFCVEIPCQCVLVTD